LLTVGKGLETNDFLNPARAIETFVDELSNWYIRRSRDRFWGSGMTDDKLSAYQTLHKVLHTLARVIAPYAPFIAEDIYGNLGGEGSVHWTDYPEADEAGIDAALENDMETARQVVELARNIRNETGIKTRQPLTELIVLLERDSELHRFEGIIKDEMNVKAVRLEQNDTEFVQFSMKLNLKTAGKKYGKHVGAIQNHLKRLTAAEAKQAVQSGLLEVKVEGEGTLRLTPDELLIEKSAKEGFASASGYRMTVMLNTAITEELHQEGLVRELVRVVQDYRKKLDLPIEKRIHLVLDVDAELRLALERFSDVLYSSVLLMDVKVAKAEGMEIFTVGDRSCGLLIK
jgi:isoleucyl-tRNA synthetase